MPLFRYAALGEGGKKVSGVIDADHFAMAKDRLLQQKLLLTKLTLLEQHSGEISLPTPLLLAFTRELGQLLRAGLPLYESLLTIEEKYRRHKTHPLFLDLCDHLKSGSSLSTALRKYPKTFDAVYLSMITVAEQSGSLSSAFDQLSHLLTRQQRLKKQLISSLTYPALLFAFCLVVISSLLFFVIPSMKDLFEDRALHPLTSFVLGVSNFANAHVPSLIAFLCGFPCLCFLLSRRKETKLAWQRASLQIPLFKKIILQSALIRFCRSTSALLLGGVPLVEALALARKVLKNALLEQVIEKAEKRIGEGEKLSRELGASPFIPSLVIRMLAIGEETGRMAPMLQHLADIYDEELERDLSQLTSLLQPVILLILGGIVGLVLLSILIPLTDVSSFTGGMT